MCYLDSRYWFSSGLHLTILTIFINLLILLRKLLLGQLLIDDGAAGGVMKMDHHFRELESAAVGCFPWML